MRSTQANLKYEQLRLNCWLTKQKSIFKLLIFKRSANHDESLKNCFKFSKRLPEKFQYFEVK